MRRTVLLAVAALATEAMASWSYDSATKTGGDSDGIWTLTFKTESTSDDLMLSKIVKNGSPASADLDLTAFESDTGHHVTRIDNSAGRVTCLTSLIAPSVTNVGSHCFYGNSTITNIAFSQGFNTALEKNQFYGCKNLTRFYPSTISGLTVIPEGMFQNCSGLEGDFCFPDVQTVGKNAFYGAAKIASLRFPSVREIGVTCMREMKELHTLELGPELQRIPSGALRDCKKLVTITPTVFPALETIGDYAMFNVPCGGNWVCDALKSIAAYGLAGCGIKSLSAPLLETVGDYALHKCANFTGSATFPGLKKVSNRAFSASGITELYLPAVTNVGDSAFDSMASLQMLALSGDIEYIGSQIVRYATKLKDIFPVEFGKIKNGGLSKQAFYEAAFTNVLSFPALTVFPAQCFYYAGKIEGIYITNVVELHDSALYKCASLKFAHISPDATVISNKVFDSCSALEVVTPFLPTNISYLGEYCFNGTKIATMPSLVSPNLKALPTNCLRGPDRYFTGAVDIYSPIEELGICAFFNVKDGQVFNFWSSVAPSSPSSLGAGCFGNGRCCRVNVKRRAALAGWLELCAGNEEKFEAMKSRKDYPGEKCIGVVYTPTSPGCGDGWHYVVDDTPPGGTALFLM